jgi:hypothetical protein
MGKQTRHLIDEADIGSGEKSPAQQETDNMIDQLGQPVERKPQSRQHQSGSVTPKQKEQGPAARKEK